MISTAFVARFQHLWKRQTQTDHAARPVAASAPPALTCSVTLLVTPAPLTVLTAQGVLDRRTCATLLARAGELYAQGCRRLLVDLRGVTRIELAGHFALHNVARLYHGEPLLDPEEGWAVLHGAATVVTGYDRVQLLASSPLATVIQQAELCRHLAVYPDLASALATFRAQ